MDWWQHTSEMVPLVSRQQFPYKNMGHNTSPWSITAVAIVGSKAHSCHFSVFYWYTEYVQKWCTGFLLCCVLLCFGTGWFYPYPSGLLHWHWGNHMIAPVPVKQPWRIWANKSFDIISNGNLNSTTITISKENKTMSIFYGINPMLCRNSYYRKCLFRIINMKS